MNKTRRILVGFLVVGLLISFVPALWAQEAGKININQATAVELAKLKGIGTAYAERIVQYREKHGLFKSPEDITNVKGIGPKTFEDNKERITVE